MRKLKYLKKINENFDLDNNGEYEDEYIQELETKLNLKDWNEDFFGFIKKVANINIKLLLFDNTTEYLSLEIKDGKDRYSLDETVENIEKIFNDDDFKKFINGDVNLLDKIISKYNFEIENVTHQKIKDKFNLKLKEFDFEVDEIYKVIDDNSTFYGKLTEINSNSYKFRFEDCITDKVLKDERTGYTITLSEYHIKNIIKLEGIERNMYDFWYKMIYVNPHKK